MLMLLWKTVYSILKYSSSLGNYQQIFQGLLCLSVKASLILQRLRENPLVKVDICSICYSNTSNVLFSLIFRIMVIPFSALYLTARMVWISRLWVNSSKGWHKLAHGLVLMNLTGLSWR